MNASAFVQPGYAIVSKSTTQSGIGTRSDEIMIQSTANLSLLFLRALIFSAILVGPVLAFAASYEGRNPSNGSIGLVLLVSLQRV
ncbi:hypothetical protein LJR231_003910 [Phyllobacterium sp. LjRoot231]|uniref:hypothetical protein n=1 Tax=Phyllobacterium sp. LjRoot231 TaxID=3342289 RepID=UPI003ED1278A